VYDVLEERHEKLPGSERTCRNYIRYLREAGELIDGVVPRIYQRVPTLPFGRQLQVDFGQYRMSSGERAYLFAAILSASRYRYVAVQDHPFTTVEVILHLLDCFENIGGRPEELVIDQDRLIVVSENSGQIIFTKQFRSFIEEQELRLWVCRKADPQSKGKVENLIKFVKTSFFSARCFAQVSEIPPKLNLWLSRRANGKICQATGRVPRIVLLEEEKKCLRSLRASIFHKHSILQRDTRKADSKSLISVGGNKYSVPVDYRGRDVEIYTTESELFVFDAKGIKEIAHHRLSRLCGEVIVHRSHQYSRNLSIGELKGRVLECFGFPEWHLFVQRNTEKFGRYAREQYTALMKVAGNVCERKRFLEAVRLCLEHENYSAANLQDAYIYFCSIDEDEQPDVLAQLSVGLKGIRSDRSRVEVKKRKLSYYTSLVNLVGACL
jgi:transposase